MGDTERARRLRKQPTDAERRLWQALRRRQTDGLKFRRQQPIGPYIVDFVCLARRLVVEVDGAHHAEQREYDGRRDRWLREQGFRVMRLSDREVLTELDSVTETIWAALSEAPLPGPPPQGGRGRPA